MPTNITISLRDDIHRRTRVEAAKCNMSMSSFLATVLESFFSVANQRAGNSSPAPAAGQTSTSAPAPSRAEHQEKDPESVRLVRKLVKTLGGRRVEGSAGVRLDGL